MVSSRVLLLLALLLPRTSTAQLSPFLDACSSQLKSAFCTTQSIPSSIEGCLCDAESTTAANAERILPLLHALTRSTYFRYWKVNLCRPCAPWPDEGMCLMRECGVDECDAAEIPACWDAPQTPPARDAALCEGGEDRGDGASLQERLSRVALGAGEGPGVSSRGWSLDDGGGGGASGGGAFAETDVWAIEEEGGGDEGSATYVNLLNNPEGFTGYAGPDAARVWAAIYEQACFEGSGGGEVGAPRPCFEERVFQRLLSGLHASISTHVAMTATPRDARPAAAAAAAMAKRDVYSGSGGGAGGGVPRAWDTALGGAGGGGSGDSDSDGAGDALSIFAAPLRWWSGAWRSGARWALVHALPSWVSHGLLEAWRSLAGAPARSELVFRPGSSSSSSIDGIAIAPLVLTPGLEPNVDMYVERLGRHPERLANLYFTYLFVARAIAKAAPALMSGDLATGDGAEDAETRSLLHALVAEAASPGGVGRGFDESAMFRALAGVGGATRASQQREEQGSGGAPPSSGAHPGQDLAALQVRHLASSSRPIADAAAAGGEGGGESSGSTEAAEALLAAYRERYRNISRILDCVGCDKCKLWGKLQFQGLGTAMKVLFAEADAALAATRNGSGSTTPPPLPTVLHLSRNEVVALINVFHRLAISLAAVGVMRDLEARRNLARALVGALTQGHVPSLIAALTASALLVCVCRCRKWKHGTKRKAE